MITSNNFKKRSGVRHSITTLVTVAAFIFQIMIPAYAAVLSDSAIQSALDANPQFERDTSNTYQYIGSPIVAANTPAATHIESFYNNLHNNYKHALVGPTYVPIGLDGITTFIPIYEKYKTVGDPLVQSRYIRAQISAMLGRTLIDTEDTAYNTEANQLNTLYANAISYVQSHPNQKMGSALGLHQDASDLGQNMAWPELRSVNGEQVLVPIVYLTASTVQAHKVTGNTTQAQGSVSLNNLIIEGVSIQLGRDAFLNVVNNLLNNDGQITGTGNLNINVGGQLHNVSGLISAGGDLVIGAKSIASETLVYRYDFGNEQGGYFGEIARIEADGSVILRAYEDIVIAGAQVSAGQDIKFGANGNIYIGTVQIVSGFSGSEGGWRTVQRSGVEYLGSSLSAEESIELIAAGGIVIDASEIVAGNGHIELLAGLGITIEDSLNSSQEYKKGKFGKTSIEVSTYKTVAMRSLLDAGKDIRIHAEFGDITLKAVDITSQNGTSVSADSGGVNLLVTTENDHYSYSSVKESLFTTTTINKGHDIVDVVPNTIVGGFQVDALSGIKVEYEGDASLSLEEQVAELAQMPGLEWMAQVRGQTSAEDWTAVESKYREWNESSTSLSAAAMALISIAVVIAVGPAVSGLYGGSAATATAAAVPASVAGSTALGAAAVASTVSLVSAATLAASNAVVNGDDPFEAAFEAVTDSETLRSAAVAAVTAGAIAKLDAKFFEPDVLENLPTDDIRRATETVTSTVNGVTVTREVATLSLAGQAMQAATHAAVNAGVQTIVEGGVFDELLAQNLLQQGVNKLGEYMANRIGDAHHDGDIGKVIQYLSHAASGCVIGVASGVVNQSGETEEYNCASGAGGAVIGELVADIYLSEKMESMAAESKADYLSKNELTEEQFVFSEYSAWMSSSANQHYYSQQIADMREHGADMAKLSGALAAFVAGGDVTIAAATAENAAENNMLMFIPLAFMLLNVIDTALTAKELYDISQLPEEQRAEALAKWVAEKGVEALIGKVIPGFKTASEMLDWLRRNNALSGKVMDSIESMMRKWDGDVPSRNRANISQGKIDEIKGQEPPYRDLPETYMSQEDIDRHIRRFDEGVTKITAATPLDAVGAPTGHFVMPRSEADRVIAQANGDVRRLEVLLGLDQDALGAIPVRVDINTPNNIRIPSGNEQGVNELWEPGGYTSGGIPEAVIDQVPKNSYLVNEVF